MSFLNPNNFDPEGLDIEEDEDQEMVIEDRPPQNHPPHNQPNLMGAQMNQHLQAQPAQYQMSQESFQQIPVQNHQNPGQIQE